ncbi:MAG: type II toxin-antitoxin system HicB family antitoxin [Candidatus Delongbacteria bacterium]|jgi:antitoxin HicB|nr:type II toxin-antitoxin system HicB family antitoxin [Candidatus Delongbacteria bacterium]
MYYYAKIEKEDGAFIVSFPDLSNINTYGETLEEALTNAEEALNGSLEADFERGFRFTKPKKYTGDEFHKVYLYPHITISYKLRSIRANQSQIDIAKKLGISYQAYQKLENPRKCNPTVKTLEKIARIFKKELEVSFR